VVVVPVVDAQANGFDLNKRSAVMERSIEHWKAFGVAVHQERRSLQTAKDECQVFFGDLVGDVGCTCKDDGSDATEECYEILAFCAICDTLEGERACFAVDYELSDTASSDDVDAECSTYTSGKFDNTICTIENLVDDTCTITIDGTECNSCVVVACTSDEEDDTTYDLDCSNVIDGETWNLCTDDIPETSLFLVYGENNDRFEDELDCSAISTGSPTSVPVPSPASPSKSPTSGAFAMSFHALSVVGLIVATTVW
jgi:hypothetical protein